MRWYTNYNLRIFYVVMTKFDEIQFLFNNINLFYFFDRKRKFEFSPAPVEIERRRQRLQCCTDVCSTLFLIPGILIAIVTPISLIPMFLLPLTYYIPLIAIFIVSGIVSVLSLAMSGLTGNIVWHYDPEKKKLKPRLHCGKGPLLHFWGNGFYSSKEDKQLLNGEKV